MYKMLCEAQHRQQLVSSGKIPPLCCGLYETTVWHKPLLSILYLYELRTYGTVRGIDILNKLVT